MTVILDLLSFVQKFLLTHCLVISFIYIALTLYNTDCYSDNRKMIQ